MNIRKWDSRDTEEVALLHEAMEVRYKFPLVDGPLFRERSIVESNGRIVAAGAIKLIGEAFLWVEPRSLKTERSGAVMLLSSQLGKTIDVEDVTAWIPPQIESGFAPVLNHLGWSRSPWASWSKVVR